MRQEQRDRAELGRVEDEDGARLMDRQELIAEVAAKIEAGDTAENIVDMIVARLTPEDGDECPVCGICP